MRTSFKLLVAYALVRDGAFKNFKDAYDLIDVTESYSYIEYNEKDEPVDNYHVLVTVRFFKETFSVYGIKYIEEYDEETIELLTTNLI